MMINDDDDDDNDNDDDNDDDDNDDDDVSTHKQFLNNVKLIDYSRLTN